jgi:dolichol kinase
MSSLFSALTEMEAALVVVSVGAASAALLACAPGHGAEAGALFALALAATALDQPSRVPTRNRAFAFRKGARGGLALGVTTVPCALAAVLLSSAPDGGPGDEAAQAWGSPLVRLYLHAALASSASLLACVGARVLERPASAARARAAAAALGPAAVGALVFGGVALPLALAASVLVAPLLRALLARLPRCFTLGEACVLALACALLAVDAALLVGCAGEGGGGGGGALCARRGDDVLAVVEVGLLCALLLGPWLAAVVAAADARGASTRARACAVLGGLGGFVGLVVYPAEYWVLGGREPLGWALAFVTARPARIGLLCYWAALTACATAAISAARRRLPLILVRKLYHALAVALFIPGALCELELMRLAFGVALALFLCGEYVRMARLPLASDALDGFLRAYTDARDAGPLITTHIYLLLGCALPVLLDPALPDARALRASAVLPPMAGVLALGVGDSMASYVGTRFGRTRWPGSPKTLEGTAAAVSGIMVGACALCAASAALRGADARGAISADECARVLLATVATCALEAATEQIDNLFLPLHFFCALRVALGRPR